MREQAEFVFFALLKQTFGRARLGTEKLTVTCLNLAGLHHLEQLMFQWKKFLFGRDLQLGC